MYDIKQNESALRNLETAFFKPVSNRQKLKKQIPLLICLSQDNYRNYYNILTSVMLNKRIYEFRLKSNAAMK